MRLQLNRGWEIGKQIGAGGFGSVFEANCSDPLVGPCVAKMVPKAPGAQRELLFVQLDNVRNVVPIIESGETDNSWVLIMPQAEESLRQRMNEMGKPFDVRPAVTILSDIATALSDLDGKVVHRDLKPENILLLEGKWCLADFGISRYAEATRHQTPKNTRSRPLTQRPSVGVLSGLPGRQTSTRLGS